MPRNEEKYSKLLEKVQELKSERDKARGALEQIQKTLAAEFDCHSITEANALLTQLEEEEVELEQQFNKELAKFEAEFGDLV